MVLGNDLNPSSAEYMQKNVDDNKVRIHTLTFIPVTLLMILEQVSDRVRVSVLDGRDFIRKSVTDIWHKPFDPLGPYLSSSQIGRWLHEQAKSAKDPDAPKPTPIALAPSRRRIDHFVMNLPGTALEFLDAFRGVLSPLRDEPGFGEVYDAMPVIHCHCFTKEMDRVLAEADIRQVRFFHSFFNTTILILNALILPLRSALKRHWENHYLKTRRFISSARYRRKRICTV